MRKIRVPAFIRRRFLLKLVLILLIAYFLPTQIFTRATGTDDFSEDLLVIAHRGGKALWPENTLYAFQHAVAMGTDMLELDVQSSADGVLVILHDLTVDRTTDGKGKVHDLSLEELKQLDAGYTWTPDKGQTYPYRGRGLTIPTLVEVFEALPETAMRIEIKQFDPPIYEPLCQLIQEYDVGDRVLALAVDVETITAFHAVCPAVATSMTVPDMGLFTLLNWDLFDSTYDPQAAVFDVPAYYGNIPLLTQKLVDEAHAQGKDVYAWTIDKPAQMEHLLRIGVDGIITNRPDILLSLLGRR